MSSSGDDAAFTSSASPKSIKLSDSHDASNIDNCDDVSILLSLQPSIIGGNSEGDVRWRTFSPSIEIPLQVGGCTVQSDEVDHRRLTVTQYRKIFSCQLQGVPEKVIVIVSL